jgi:alkylation response protein AidB-like acyl-CoA dehydrogenase
MSALPVSGLPTNGRTMSELPMSETPTGEARASAERSEFAAALHAMLGAADGPAAARSWADGDLRPGLALWGRLAELEVTALAVPEKWGGLGTSPADLVAACEELGHHAVPGPVPESLAAVPALLAALDETDRLAVTDGGVLPVAGDAAGRCGEWLAGLAAGDLIATLAMPPWLPFATDAEVAGLVLLAEGDVVSVGTSGAWHRSVDPARSLSAVTGQEVVAHNAGAAVARAFDLGTLACSAQLLGAGRALLEMSVRHVSVRTQFGQPVGAFQAVKHKLADVAIGLEFARPLLDAAAAAIGDGAATASRDVSAAKVACADAAHRAARAALQVHGAVGYTAEHDLGLWLTRVRALVPAWGSQAEHRERVMAALAASPEPARIPGPAPGESPWT